MTKVEALAKFLGCDVEDVVVSKYDENTLEAEGSEYLVLTDSEADEKVADSIKQSLWAFNAEFIASHTKVNLGEREIEALRKMQSELCEDAGPLVEAMIEDLDAFIRDAVSSDGRGHFLSTYDGNEVEQDEFLIYQTN